MSILIGHPSGAVFAFHAALAHYQNKHLAAFCVPWRPGRGTLQLLGMIPGAGEMTRRLSRRRFESLADAPMIQGRAGEIRRLLIRALGLSSDALAIEANEWLMHTMRRECRRAEVTAVHAYEDCSLLQFEEARKRNKACIYDMPIGYWRAWQEISSDFDRRYADWLPSGGQSPSSRTPLHQKSKEMDLADLVLVPSSFVRDTIQKYVSDRRIALAPYGVDLDFWKSNRAVVPDRPLRFLYAGHLSIRKGTPLLLEAWKKAALKDAELMLVGPWRLAISKQSEITGNIRYRPPCSPSALREGYREADVFVLPSFFEGFALVLLEAMSSGLPAIASDATGGLDSISMKAGHMLPRGDLEALIESLRWFSDNRSKLPAMSLAARQTAEQYTWANYRCAVSKAVAPFL
jgi:glycosyltransferase involved in cell wall biosynthesis